jgi:type VI protein secretion system component VasK
MGLLLRRWRQRWQRRELLVSDEEDNSVTSLHQSKGSSLADDGVTAPSVPPPPLPVQSSTSQKPESDPMAVVAGQGTEQIPKLLHKLQTAHTTGCDQAARALRQLFALSEYGSTTAIQRHNDGSQAEPVSRMEEIRREMIADGTLVPALLQFLERCRTECLPLRCTTTTTALGTAAAAVLLLWTRTMPTLDSQQAPMSPSQGTAQ